MGRKHAVDHNGESGTIFSVAGEVILPTGDESKGLGADGSALEAFLAFGQILPSDAFIQLQAGVEVRLYAGSANGKLGRNALGCGFSLGAGGRR